ncbi:MAG: hypothetical protein HQ567_20450 [Candidatus Nealsonbacteria bacterium]|nr:hypothetical protein [Candidatus Nealsonbacteria bacterium]
MIHHTDTTATSHGKTGRLPRLASRDTDAHEPHPPRAGTPHLSPRSVPYPVEEHYRIADVRKHLEICVSDLRQIEQEGRSRQDTTGAPEAGISTITIRLLAACLSELLKLERRQDHREYCPDLCQLLDCPQHPVLRSAVGHTIQVLQQTRGKFKSKELAELRVLLEALLENSEKFLHTP